jgi:phytoene synthase
MNIGLSAYLSSEGVSSDPAVLADEGRAALRPEDVAACQRILAQGSKSFHAAGRLLPFRLRGPIAVLYAFCRVADDAVDLEGGADKGAAVERLAQRLACVYDGTAEDLPVDRAFAQVVRAYRIPRAVPEALIEGFRWDAERRRYERFADVVAYAARVASTVGVMMTLVMGVRDPVTLARACDLGVAMQLTNIARDVGEDARERRLYLPLEWLREVGIDPDSFLAAPRYDGRLARVVRRLLSRAEWLYARADSGIPRLPRDVRTAIRAARLVYADIGREIADAGYDTVSRRAHTSALRKATLLARALPAAWVPAPLLGGLRALGPEAASPPLPEARFLVDAVRAADTA